MIKLPTTIWLVLHNLVFLGIEIKITENMEILSTEAQIRVLELAKADYEVKVQEIKKEHKPRVRGAYLCGVVEDVICREFNLPEAEVQSPTVFIPMFSRENAAVLAKKYKFKKPGDGSYWWNLEDSCGAFAHIMNKDKYDSRNRHAFLNALIKELKELL